MSLRFGLCVLKPVVAGAFLFIFVSLCTIAFVAGRNCGPAFGYYGCQLPIANISNEGDQAALPRRSGRAAAAKPRTIDLAPSSKADDQSPGTTG